MNTINSILLAKMKKRVSTVGGRYITAIPKYRSSPANDSALVVWERSGKVNERGIGCDFVVHTYSYTNDSLNYGYYDLTLDQAMQLIKDLELG